MGHNMAFQVLRCVDYQILTPSWEEMAKFATNWIIKGYARGSTYLSYGAQREHIDVEMVDDRHGESLNFRLVTPTPEAYAAALDAIAADLYSGFDADTKTITYPERFDRASIGL